ncbi:hypothetical protein CkaCkLH20_11580 [Colletotrichum karsti]|uniref:Uncharacterized protein n=1 Tax=Colletotrichum karsti TaxID=1095194 RepID=A0A9P6HTP6_9PEZI|nr:uncharacterized protein CkaCkLH20_11580 [Colletotrichum karsti]KAF9870908.1 hypothetical protein CkaCkLH20_11580 [Colletotrichum karsti]
MEDNGFAYVFRGGCILVLIMMVWHGGNAIVGFLPPVGDYFHHITTIVLVLHAIPLLPWLYLQIVDPVIADSAPWLALSPQDALRIEERTGRYASFFLLPYPKFLFSTFMRAFQSVAKFLYDVAFDFEETILNHSVVYPHTVALRNYIRSKLGQAALPANRQRLRYADSSTSTTLTQAEIQRACMKPRVVCEDNLLLLRNAENERSLVLRTQENDHEEERRGMRQQITTLQNAVQGYSQWDYSLMYRQERRLHNETREQLERARIAYEALQEESNMNHETVEEEERENDRLTRELEAARAATNNNGTHIQSLEQEIRRLSLLVDNQRVEIESNQQELAQHVANQIRLQEEDIIIPDHIRVVLEEKFAAAIEENKQQIHTEYSQRFEAELQEHKTKLEHDYPGDRLQSFAEETANIENEKKRLQAECEDERQRIEVERQAIQRARDTIERDRQSITQEKERVESECRHQLQLIAQERETIRSDRDRIETELQNERQLIEQEKQRVQSDRAQLDRDSQTQRQTMTQDEERMVQERSQIQSEFEKLQDERLRLQQDQEHVREQTNETPQTKRDADAVTDYKRRIAELEEEVDQYEKLLHEEKSKDKSALQEHQRLKEDFVRMKAENEILKARLSTNVANPSESPNGVMDFSVAPAAPTQTESTEDIPAALTTPMDVSDMSNAPADVDNSEDDPVFQEMLQDVEAEDDMMKREEKAKEMLKNYSFSITSNGTEGTKNPFTSTPSNGEVEENVLKNRKVLQPRSLKIRKGNMYGTTNHETGEGSSQAPNNESTRPRTARKEPVATGQVAAKRPRPTTARKEPYTLPPLHTVSEEDEDEDGEGEEDQETEIEYEEEDALSEAE